MANSQDPKTVAPEGASPMQANAPGDVPQGTPPSQQPMMDPREAIRAEQEMRAQIADAHMPPAVPDPPDMGKDYMPQTDSEKSVFRATARPDESLTAGPVVPAPVLPPDAGRWLPSLIRAAQAPGAPPQLMALAKLYSQKLNNR